MQRGNLCLTVKVGEAVRIGEDIDVTVTWVKGRQVRLLFQAPKQIRVLRKELLSKEAKHADRATA